MQIRPYTKQELAIEYAPDLLPRSAVNRLVKWMNYSKPLMKDLFRAGYRPTQKMLTKRQVGIIVKHLGEP